LHDTPPSAIYTLSLHDALPISSVHSAARRCNQGHRAPIRCRARSSGPSTHQVGRRRFTCPSNRRSTLDMTAWRLRFAAVSVMRPEIETLIELIARSIYERWKAGEVVPGAPAPPPPNRPEPLPQASKVA